MARERVVRHQPDDLPTLADHDLGIEGKPTCDFNAQLRTADGLPDHEGTRRANIDGIEVLQLFGERSRSEGSVTADVEAPHKTTSATSCLLLAPLKRRSVGRGRNLIQWPYRLANYK
jgi:hypothetical protein